MEGRDAAPRRARAVTTYDPEAVEVLKGMLDLPTHQFVPSAGWLNDYINHGRGHP